MTMISIIFAVQVNYQLGVNKDCRHQLERDLANKDHGINIDHTVHNMKNTSGGINLHGGIERVDNHVSIPDSWVDYSHRNIQVLIMIVLNDRHIFPNLGFSSSQVSNPAPHVRGKGAEYKISSFLQFCCLGGHFDHSVRQ